MELGFTGCGDCSGTCCRKGVVIPLKPAEALQLETAGTDMRQLSKEEYRGNRPGRGREFYQFLGDCGNLDPETALCRDYEARPAACREFRAGSVMCQIARLGAEMRAEAAVDLPMPVPRQREPQEDLPLVANEAV